MPNVLTSAKAAICAAVLAVSLAAPAQAGLPDEAEINEGLIATAIAYEIGEVCGTISARMFRGINYLNSLRDRARALGYSNAEIDAYVGNREEKRRLEAIARARLADMGAVVGQEATYCTVGRNEIAADTAIGRLLR